MITRPLLWDSLREIRRHPARFFSILAIVGLLGVVMRRFGFPTAPVVVGMILGPLAEAQLRNALSIGEGHWSVLVERPMSATLLAVIVSV